MTLQKWPASNSSDSNDSRWSAPLNHVIDDLLMTALEGRDTWEGFNLESFLSDGSPSSDSLSVLTMFTLFPKLAPELRLKIWAQAYADLKGRRMAILPPLVKVPSLLQVCYESRKMGLGIYTRQKHESINYMPSFVTIIDFEKDTIDLSARGKFINPNPSASCTDTYLYKARAATYPLRWKNNLLMYTIYHYPELCKYVKRLTLRSCYLSWLSRFGLCNILNPELSVEEFFKTHFPALETVAMISSGVAENPEGLDGLSDLEVSNRQLVDITMYRVLQGMGKKGGFKFTRRLDHTIPDR
ncbi:hypothetical protein ONS95_000534 [Cadophora gregata]|uniref:uncharacterized protein n=1 Tax=Cadophora gregata TaxID=51156 RepID=UPI0026DB154E|nr:uncharacterized protein ONS95_000534 [Cadophora gregata]KAK0125452.1 hypothetical protein ONS96_009293 [Cadophora gregata f. sp. sojae]KAK0128570.1 hypothetical protein ONS95_000534 [Cadophora gregata]